MICIIALMVAEILRFFETQIVTNSRKMISKKARTIRFKKKENAFGLILMLVQK